MIEFTDRERWFVDFFLTGIGCVSIIFGLVILSSLGPVICLSVSLLLLGILLMIGGTAIGCKEITFRQAFGKQSEKKRITKRLTKKEK